MRNHVASEKSNNEIVLLGGITDHKLALLRLILAVSALLIIYIDPTEPDRYVHLTYVSIVAFALYSLFIYVAARQRINFPGSVMTWLLWIDIAWCTALIAMSSGTSSIFYFFYVFEIIVASSRGGRRLGLAATAASSILCVSVGLIAPSPGVFEVNRFLLRPLAIIALGYTMAYWGGAELALKKKLVLLKELSTVANPRFGVDRTIDQILGRLLTFYHADYCILLLDPVAGSQVFRATDPALPDGMLLAGAEDAVRKFLIRDSDSRPGVFSSSKTPEKRRPTYRKYNPQTNKVVSLDPAPAESVSGLLRARSLIAVTCQYREHLRGRLLVSSQRANAFDFGDAVFLLQVANQVLPMIENIRLVDRLASDASEAERQRIARSVHDRVIQPYYGLQIGLKALQDILETEQRSRSDQGVPFHHSGKPELLLEQLMTMTTEGITELREYVYGLRQTPANATRLADSIRRFAGKFEGATGIRVDVEGGNDGFAANDRLTAELFQMTAEALSNIHRHTHARSAQVSFNLQSNNLILQVANETEYDAGPIEFSPSSISERADALGGTTEVLWQRGRTIVRVEVPL